MAIDASPTFNGGWRDPKPKPGVGSGAYTRVLLMTGRYHAERILELVHEHYPMSKAGKSDVAWNREAFDASGYFRTGDLGFLDDADYLRFRGRLKEMIKTGGINVAPVEVEESLLRYPGVKLAFVTGVPDARRDEVIAAVIVRHDGTSVDEPALAAHCRRELAAYKVPRLFKFVDEADLPLTTTGKLQKNRLAEFFRDAPADART